jgi:hypothetical protein
MNRKGETLNQSLLFRLLLYYKLSMKTKKRKQSTPFFKVWQSKQSSHPRFHISPKPLSVPPGRSNRVQWVARLSPSSPPCSYIVPQAWNGEGRETKHFRTLWRHLLTETKLTENAKGCVEGEACQAGHQHIRRAHVTRSHDGKPQPMASPRNVIFPQGSEEIGPIIFIPVHHPEWAIPSASSVPPIACWGSQ